MDTPEQIAREVTTAHAVPASGRRLDEIQTLIARAIRTDRARRAALVLSFEPDAIRAHFDADEHNPTSGMSDEQLERIGEAALSGDRLYAVFHEALKRGLAQQEVTGE